jgi:hypothetical protein
MNEKIFAFLLEKEKDLAEVEDILIDSIPHAFVNFLGLEHALIELIIKNQAQYLKNTINTKDTKLTQTIQRYNQLSQSIQSQFDVLKGTRINFLQSFEESFLYSMLIAQYLRVLLLKPKYASYQFEKILSKPEKRIFKTSQNQFKYEDMPCFEFTENIITDAFGDVDIEETQNLEEKTDEIKIFFSSFHKVTKMSKYLQVQMQNHAKHLVFSNLNPKLLETLCSAVASIFAEKYTKSIYFQLKSENNLEAIAEKTKSYLQDTALNYLRNQEIKDQFKLKEDVHKASQEIMNSQKEFPPKLILEITNDLFETAIKSLILQWYEFPKNFFNFSFRLLEPQEIVSHEAKFALDAFIYKQDGQLNTKEYETYAITLDKNSQDMLYTLASQNIQNPKHIQKVIDKYFEPLPFARIVKKINDLTYSMQNR